MFAPTLVIPGPAVVAPAASAAAGFKARARRVGRGVWNALLIVGQRRAVRELRVFVASHGDQFPDVATQLRALEAEAGLRQSA